MSVLALDLGGTKVAGAVVSRQGDVLHRMSAPLEGRRGADVGGLVTRMAVELSGRAGGRVEGAGVAVPGIYHPSTGTVWAPNIGGWEDYPLRAELSAALGPHARVTVDSDRACCIVGEAWRGAARGSTHAVFLAVGTGIGAGILADGRVLRGRRDIAGAIGWLALDRPFRADYVPVGCFEYHASGEGLVRVARDLLSEDAAYRGRLRGRAAALSARDVLEAEAAGDPLAARVVERAIGFWGMAVANLVSLFNPEQVILGGGVFGPAARFLDRIVAEASRWAQPISMREVRVQVSELGADAALLGAARLALNAAR